MLNRKKNAFTLVELIIVVAILGILAAIILPEFQGHVQKAKEAAAKDNLRILREAIERYAIDHNGVSPGYTLNNTASTPDTLQFNLQLVFRASNALGQLADFGTGGYPFGPYLTEIPENPFNKRKTIWVIDNTTIFPASPIDSYGWIYKPSTKDIRLDTSEVDSQGTAYFSY